MIKAIIKGIFNLIIGLVNTLLTPIDSVIAQFLPGLSDVLNAISSFFSYIGQFLNWICSWFHFPSWLITFVIAYYVFKLTVPLAIHTVKLAMGWYDKLKI